MKVLLSTLFLLLFVAGTSFSQEERGPKELFIRIYDARGKKIAKGDLVSVSNQELQLRHRDSIHLISANEIASIKTRRSFGSDILWGSIVGGSFGSFLVVRHDGDSEVISSYSSEELGAAVFGGAFLGGFVGMGNGLIRKKAKFEIQGDFSELRAFFYSDRR